jgi:hypothetical protein
MSTNPRVTWRQISTLKLAYRLTFINISFVLLHSILFLCLLEILPFEGCSIIQFSTSKLFNIFLLSSFKFYWPFNCYIYNFSLLAYRNVRRIIRHQMPVFRRRLDRQLTAMVLARVTCVVSLGTPFIIYSMYRFNLHLSYDNRLGVAIDTLVYVIVTSLLYLNFSVS